MLSGDEWYSAVILRKGVILKNAPGIHWESHIDWQLPSENGPVSLSALQISFEGLSLERTNLGPHRKGTLGNVFLASSGNLEMRHWWC